MVLSKWYMRKERWFPCNVMMGINKRILDTAPSRKEEKHIENAKKYVGAQDVLWWDIFSLDQQKIIDYCSQSHWPVTIPFTWSFGINSPALCCNPLLVELRQLAHPLQRDLDNKPILYTSQLFDGYTSKWWWTRSSVLDCEGYLMKDENQSTLLP